MNQERHYMKTIGLLQDKIRSLNSERDALDIKLQARHDQLLEMKGLVNDLNSVLTEKESEAAALGAELEELRDKLKQKELRCDLLQQEKKHKDTELEQLKRLISGIYSSKTWRLSRVYGNVFGDRSAGLALNRLIDVTATHINILRTEGLKAYVLHSYEYRKGRLLRLFNRDQSFVPEGPSGSDLLKINLAKIVKEHPGVRGILVYKSILDWNIPLFQRPHQLAWAFAEKGLLVFYYTPNWRYDNYEGFNRIRDNLYVFHGDLGVFNTLEAYMVLLNWNIYSALKAFESPKIIYDYVDHIELLSMYDEQVLSEHLDLVKKADVMSVTAEDLLREIKTVRDDVLLCSNAADPEHFRIARPDIPEDIRFLVESKKPVIGYYGALAEWFDYELIKYAAEQRPQYEFLLVGYDYDESFKNSGLSDQNNISRIGPVHYNVLPDYLYYFDVAIIPFRLNKITLATSPVKLFEYAAGGKPVVSTALPECEKYDPVLISRDKEEFVRLLDRALGLGKDPVYLAKLGALADNNTWKARAEQFISAFELKGLLRKPALPDCLVNPGVQSGPDIISMPVMPWFSRFQRSQQLLTRFAGRGSRVFRLDTNFGQNSSGYEKTLLGAGLYHVSLSTGRSINIWQEALDERACMSIVASLKELAINEDIPVAVCIVELPFWGPAAERLKKEFGWKIIYDCMDDHSGFSTNSPEMTGAEERLARVADLIVASSEALFSRMSALNPVTVLVPNGADYEHFSNLPPPGRPANTNKPVIGYFGAISEWFDDKAVEYAAKKHPQWNFVLIGNTFGGSVGALKRLENVSFPGEKNYAELPGYLSEFDVCILPRKLNALTKAMNPVKFYEYLSSGKPVVSSSLPELQPYADLVYLASDEEDFEKKICAALDEKDDSKRLARRAFARANNWDERVALYSASISGLFEKVSIIVVTYNNIGLTRLCMDSLFAFTRYPNMELIVVDNNSTDSTREYLSTLGRLRGNVRIIQNDENRGFAAANNQGLSIASGQYLVLLNNDTVVTPSWVIKLIRHLRDGSVGMAGPVTNMCGNEARMPVTYDTTTLDGFEAFLNAYFRRHFYPEPFDIGMLGMFCVALRKETYDKTGPLDERFGIGTFEDTDYALRLNNLGYRLVCARDVFIHHFCNASFGKLENGEYGKIFEENRKKFENKWKVTWNG